MRSFDEAMSSALPSVSYFGLSSPSKELCDFVDANLSLDPLSYLLVISHNNRMSGKIDAKPESSRRTYRFDQVPP